MNIKKVFFLLIFSMFFAESLVLSPQSFAGGPSFTGGGGGGTGTGTVTSTGTFTDNNAACWSGTLGDTIKDCGASFGAGVDGEYAVYLNKNTTTFEACSGGVFAYTFAGATGEPFFCRNGNNVQMNIEQITAVFDGGGSAITTGIKKVYVHRDYAISAINKWTLTCDLGGSDATPIIVNVGGKVTTAATSGALPTIASNDFCGTGTPPTGNSSTAIVQAVWNCATTSIAANSDLIFSVTQAPTASTWCSVTLEVTK